MESRVIFLGLLISLSVLLVNLPCHAHSAGLRIYLRHVDSDSNIAVKDLIKRAVNRSKYRKEFIGARITSSALDVQAPLKFGNQPVEYYMDLAIGSPPLPITAVMDTGSDLVWTQCQPCDQCVSQMSTIYDPSRSSTFSSLSCTTSPLCQAFGSNSNCDDAGSCHYAYSYGDKSSTEGILGSETFTFGDSSVHGVGFGCGTSNSGLYTGIVGLGQGALSLPSQLNSGKFSYCLTMSRRSLLLVGSSASLQGSSTGRAQSTPFLSDKRWYLISLQGISLGATPLPIPSTTFQYKADGTGGTMIDSGTSLTLLQQPAYNILKQELVSLVNLPVVNAQNTLDLDLCFQVTTWPPPSVPDMTLHFDGADMTVPPENYMMADRESGLYCLLVLPTDFSTSILGNYLQQNMHILYDLSNRVLSFAPAQCDQL